MNQHKRTTVAIAQVKPRLGDLAYNLEMHIERARQAIDLGAELVIFPELSLTGYTLKDLTQDVAHRIGSSGPLDRLIELSSTIAILVGFVEEEDYVYYNSAALLDGGEIVHVHRKVYLPTYGMFDEERYFSPGGTFRSIDTRFGRLGVLICEDYWHPSSVYLLAQDGALVHVYMANAPVRGMTLPDEITSTRIAENTAALSSQVYGVYSIYANRVGVEDGITFGGRSRVFSPTGSAVARAGETTEELVLAEIDPEQIRRARVFFPLQGDEKLDLVHRELSRIKRIRFNEETNL